MPLVEKPYWASCGKGPDPIFLFLGESGRRNVLLGLYSFWMPGCLQCGVIKSR
jgi:hypothetical protein